MTKKIFEYALLHLMTSKLWILLLLASIRNSDGIYGDFKSPYEVTLEYWNYYDGEEERWKNIPIDHIVIEGSNSDFVKD